MTSKPTPTIEDYLGVIYTINRDGEKVIGARLAELMDVSPPTVTVTLKRMMRDGWITIDKKKCIHLTASGNDAARSVIRRHMLTEWLLSRVLDIPWSELHAEADKIEHTISHDVEKRLLTALEEPELCPHGNPMPGQEGQLTNWKPINEFTDGDTCIIRRIHELLEDKPEVMHFLEENFMLPGEVATIEKNNKSDNVIKIRIKNSRFELDSSLAEKIFAEEHAFEEGLA